MAKKKFLMGVGAAVAVVAAGLSTTHAKKVYEDNTGSKFQTENSILSDLLMEEQTNPADVVQTAGHSSHASHGSHGSHASHSSHSSGM